MGRVMTKIKLTNFVDMEKAREGLLPPDQVRSEEIEALVDTGATMLVLPADVVQRLGVPQIGRRHVRYANGQSAFVPWVAGLMVEILGRQTNCEALVEAAGTTPLLGQIPLEAIDLHVDPKSKELTVNPASPDAPLLDLLHVA
ncbi:MAG: retroviral-like aspartic protease family protein [Deltaproteobacteria bacterium]|nr:retroviral-like aspartic protease family protein [Deltaproteobacteria bacterium]